MPNTEKRPGKLLIVDSSEFITDRLKTMLREAKLVEQIFTATDYHAALGILHKENMDIVLLDIQLPDKNGLGLLKHMVQHFPKTKVVVLSNLVSDFYQNLCKKAGASYFIDKSKEFDKIPEVLSAILKINER